MKPIIAGILILCFSFTSLIAEELDEQTAHRMVIEINRAQNEADFERLVDFAHPQSLNSFRRMILIGIERLEERFDPDSVVEIVSFSSHELQEFSDKEFFLHICAAAANIYPGLGYSRDPEDLILLGIVQDRSHYHVLYRMDTLTSGETDELLLHRPWIATFLFSDGKWQLRNILYTRQILWAFQRELALAEGGSEQDEGDNSE